MGRPNPSQLDSPLGPLRDKRTVAIATDDYEDAEGFLCQVGSAGSITYRTLSGETDQTETGLTAGDIVNACGIPVLLVAVRGSSSVTSIVVGKL